MAVRDKKDLAEREELISPKSLSKRKQDDIVTLVLDNCKRAVNDRADLEKRWLERWKINRGKRQDKTTPWKGCSNLHIPISSSVQDNLLPRLASALLDQKPVCQVNPREFTDSERALLQEKFLDYELLTEINSYRMTNAYMTLVMWIDQTIGYGTGYIKPTWETIYKRRGDRSNGKTVWNDVVAYDAPVIDNIPLLDMIVPSDALDIQLCDFVAHRVWRPMDYCKRMVALGKFNRKNVSDIEADEASIIQSHFKVEKDQAEGIYPAKTRTSGKDVEIIEYHGYYDLDGDGYEEDCVFHVAYGNQKLLRWGVNDYWHGARPFLASYFKPDMERFYGWGVIERLESVNKAINTLINMTIDAGSLANLQEVFFDSGMGLDIRKMVRGPGAFHPVRSVQGIKALDVKGPDPSLLNMVHLLRGFVQQDMGVSDYSMGLESGVSQNKTARGIMSLISEGNKRFDMHANFLRNPFANLYWMIIQLNYQFMPPQKLFRVLGQQSIPLAQEFVTIQRDDLAGKYDYIPSCQKASDNRELERIDLIQFLQYLVNFKDMVNVRPIVKTIVDLFPNARLNRDEIVIPELQYAQSVIQQYQQRQRAQQQEALKQKTQREGTRLRDYNNQKKMYKMQQEIDLARQRGINPAKIP